MSSQTVLRNTLTRMIIIYILIKSLKAPEYLLLFWTSLVWNFDISFLGIKSLYEAYSSTPDYCSEEGQQDVATQLTHVTSFIIALQLCPFTISMLVRWASSCSRLYVLEDNGVQSIVVITLLQSTTWSGCIVPLRSDSPFTVFVGEWVRDLSWHCSCLSSVSDIPGFLWSLNFIQYSMVKLHCAG